MLFSAAFMPRFRRLVIISVSTVLVCFTARPGFADWTYRLSAEGAVGAVENPRGQSTQNGPRAAGTASTQGQLELNHIGRLTREGMAYGISFMSWFPSDQTLYLTQTLRLSEMIEATPDTRFGLTGGATLSQRSLLNASAPTDPQTSGPRPAGDQKYVGVDAGETFASQFAGAWQFSQALTGRFYRSLGNQAGLVENRGATLDLGVSRAWARDVVFAQSRLGIMSSTNGTTAGQPTTPDLTGKSAQLQLGWRYAWTAEVSHSLAAGAFVLQADRTRVFPAGSANLSWQSRGYQAELRAARLADSNIFIGQVFQQDLVGLRFLLPLDRLELLRASADASLERDSIESTTLGADATAVVMMARLGLGWQAGNLVTLGLLYTFRDQRVSGADSSPALLSSFRQQMLVFTVGIQYPPLTLDQPKPAR
jgi:hypothetical protein